MPADVANECQSPRSLYNDCQKVCRTESKATSEGRPSVTGNASNDAFSSSNAISLAEAPFSAAAESANTFKSHGGAVARSFRLENTVELLAEPSDSRCAAAVGRLKV